MPPAAPLFLAASSAQSFETWATRLEAEIASSGGVVAPAPTGGQTGEHVGWLIKRGAACGVRHGSFTPTQQRRRGALEELEAQMV